MKRALLFGGVPAIAGIALIVMWAMADEAASRGNDWTQVLGTIESANVQPGSVDVAYRYEYGGRQHRNPAGHLTIRDGSRPVERYAAGRQILAYVNPTTPSESILEPAPRPSSVNIIAGVVLLIIGLPLAGYFLRERQPQFRPRRKPTRNLKKPSKPSKPMSRLKPPPSVPRK